MMVSNDRNMEHVLMGLIQLVVTDGIRLSVFKLYRCLMSGVVLQCWYDQSGCTCEALIHNINDQEISLKSAAAVGGFIWFTDGIQRNFFPPRCVCGFFCYVRADEYLYLKNVDWGLRNCVQQGECQGVVKGRHMTPPPNPGSRLVQTPNMLPTTFPPAVVNRQNVLPLVPEDVSTSTCRPSAKKENPLGYGRSSL